MTNKSTIDAQEIAKFAELSGQWWDVDGPLKTLHDINPARLEFILKYQDLNNKSVIDLGCGGGILSEAMAKKGAQVLGLDVEEEAIETAKAHAKENGLTINYHCCPIEDYERESVDLITCMEMLEHVKEPQIVINHCADLLKPGGSLFLSTINRTLKAYLGAIIGAEYILGLLPKQTHDFEKFIKPSELLGMIRKAGLEFSAMSGIAYNPFTRIAKLQASVEINYIIACFKPHHL